MLRLALASIAATLAIDLAIELAVVHTRAGPELSWSLGGAAAAQLASVVLGCMKNSNTTRT